MHKYLSKIKIYLIFKDKSNTKININKNIYFKIE